MLALPQWPHARHIELAPKYWAATRARILAAEKHNADVLRDGIGNRTIPAAPSPLRQRSCPPGPTREAADRLSA